MRYSNTKIKLNQNRVSQQFDCRNALNLVIFSLIFLAFESKAVMYENDFQNQALINFYSNAQFDDSEFCLIRGDLILYVSCPGSEQSYIIDAQSFINPVITYDDKTKLNQMIFNEKIILSQSTTKFENITDVYFLKGSLNIITLNSTIQRQKSYSVFYDGMDNTTKALEYIYRNSVTLQRVFYDGRIYISKFWNSDIGEFIEFYSFLNRPTVDYSRLMPGKQFNMTYEIIRELNDDYSIYVGWNNSFAANSYLIYYKITSSNVALKSIFNLTLKSMCTEKIAISESLIVILCETRKKLQIFKRNGTSLLGDLVIPSNWSFTKNKINGHIPIQNMFIISRQSHNYIFFMVTNVTYFTRQVIIQRNGTDQLVNQTANSTLYQLYFMEIIISPSNQIFTNFEQEPEILYQSDKLFQFQKIYDNYLLKQSYSSPQFYSYTPVCFYDESHYKQKCSPCPPGSYSLYFNNPACYSCLNIETYVLNQFQTSKLKFLCNNNMTSIYGARNYSVDQYNDPINLIKISDNNQNNNNTENGGNNTIVIDGSGGQSESKLSNWTIALLVVVIVTSTFSSVTVIIFLLRKRMLMRRGIQRSRVQNGEILRHIDESEVDDSQTARQRARQDREKQRKTKIEKIKKLAPKQKYSSIEHKQLLANNCVICCDEFNDNDYVRETQCRHIFHSQCIMQWVLSQLYKENTGQDQPIADPYCPTCKANMQVEVEKRVQKDLGLENQRQIDNFELPPASNIIDTDRNHSQSNRFISEINNNHNLEEIPTVIIDQSERQPVQEEMVQVQINNLVGAAHQSIEGPIDRSITISRLIRQLDEPLSSNDINNAITASQLQILQENQREQL
ncbi:zinc finger protein [Stylonychia lemnae]|uniref:Zinc finger protein n=1 Tax=Stylonychia lemnae TaxID=5949 RepID=A0A077ZZS0_STYLE|nr:zinc finger protein [Stylonychia lemnae]|eukprot:CDW75385.1 zinc finger protein [Stylonychia lemnae]